MARVNKAYTYILRCAEGPLYVGSTTDLEDRLRRHQSGNGSQFAKLHKPVELIYKEEYDTYQQAFKRERQLHGWTVAKKEALIKGDIELLADWHRRHPPLDSTLGNGSHC